VTWSGLPVTISFFGREFSEGQLLGYGYDFEQAAKARVLAKYTPALPSDLVGMTVAWKNPELACLV
jgi:amidase